MIAIREQWNIAQAEERKLHTHTIAQAKEIYYDTYRQYFDYLGIQREMWNHRIIEIGCADVPALSMCSKFRWGIILEPMPSPILQKLLSEAKETIRLMPVAAEDFEFPEVEEVWLFNVLQHVIDPETIIDKSKRAAQTIRFFEPINTPTDKCHLHSFTLDYFRDVFGDCVKEYRAKDGVRNFHEQECAYGVWKKYP